MVQDSSKDLPGILQHCSAKASSRQLLLSKLSIVDRLRGICHGDALQIDMVMQHQRLRILSSEVMCDTNIMKDVLVSQWPTAREQCINMEIV